MSHETQLHSSRHHMQPSAGGRDLAEELRARSDTGVPPPRRRGGASDAAGATGFVDGRPTDARAFVGTVGLPADGVSLMIILREVSTASAEAASQAMRLSSATRARSALRDDSGSCVV